MNVWEKKCHVIINKTLLPLDHDNDTYTYMLLLILTYMVIIDNTSYYIHIFIIFSIKLSNPLSVIAGVLSGCLHCNL